MSLAPARSYSAFFASRICATREKFTSNTECTCADVRRLSDHVLGDLLPHHRHRRRRAGHRPPTVGAWRVRRGGRRPRRGTRPGGAPAAAGALPAPPMNAEDVVLGHAAGDAGAVNLRDVDVVLLRDLPHERRRPLPDHVLDARSRGRRRGGAAGRGTRRPARSRRGRRRAGAAASRRAGARPARRAAAGAAAATPAAPITATTLFTGTVSPSLARISAIDAGRRRRDLGVDLVGRDLEQRLVALDRVADLLDPADDRAFGDRLAHLRHHDIGRHKSSQSVWYRNRSSSSPDCQCSHK